jgi:RimJ/RimL family protein N-acetyltransferase
VRVILTTERLRLREMTAGDAGALLRLNANPNVIKYVGDPALADEAEALAVFTGRILPQYRDHGVGRWAVELRDGGEFLGWCGLKYLPETDEYDLGYRFFEHAWGRGYATEAARGTVEWARAHLPGRRVVGKAMLGNLGSIRVLEKIGLRFEKRERDQDGKLAVYVL